MNLNVVGFFDFTIPTLTLVFLLAMLIAALLIGFWAFARYHLQQMSDVNRSFTIACFDSGAVHPPGMRKSGRQIQSRIIGGIDVCFNDVTLFQFADQLIGCSVQGDIAFRGFAYTRPIALRPYTDDLARFILENPEICPVSWRGKDIVFAGRTYEMVDEAERVWTVLRVNENGDVSIRHVAFAEGYGVNCFFACSAVEQEQNLATA